MDMKKLKKIVMMGCIAAAVTGIAIQFVPVEKTNPPVTAEISVASDLHQIFRRSCYDCHSNETKWPWYGNIAPVSWFLVGDVSKGREYMNFSVWNNLSAKGQEHLRGTIWKEVSEDEMPLFIYRLAHPNARLSDSEKELIKKWATNQS
jgi:hypothetical protein